MLLTMHNGRQLYTNTIPVSTEQDPQRQWPQVCGLDRIICSAIKIEATQHKQEKASFRTQISTNDTRASRPVAIQQIIHFKLPGDTD